MSSPSAMARLLHRLACVCLSPVVSQKSRLLRHTVRFKTPTWRCLLATQTVLNAITDTDGKAVSSHPSSATTCELRSVTGSSIWFIVMIPPITIIVPAVSLLSPPGVVRLNKALYVPVSGIELV